MTSPRARRLVVLRPGARRPGIRRTAAHRAPVVRQALALSRALAQGEAAPGRGAPDPRPPLSRQPDAPHAPVLPLGPLLPGVTGPLLAVEHVSAAYGTYRALFDVSLQVDAGGIVAVLGPNGAGKSTLARTLSGLVRPTAGRVLLGGVEVTGLPAHRLARRGLVHVPEGRAVFASLSVEENLLLAFGSRLEHHELAAALDRAYTAFPVLAQRRRQLAGTLSGGQQRLLSMAKVLAAPARLLVVDELSLGLAPAVVDAVYDGLMAIRQQGTALLVVEQQVERALAIADQAVVLAHGRVAWSGPAAEAADVAATEALGPAPAPRMVGPSAVSPLAAGTSPTARRHVPGKGTSWAC